MAGVEPADHENHTADGGRAAASRGGRAVGLLEALGTLPERAPVGDGARGLQPPRQCLGGLPPRSRPVARVPVGRGRARRHLGQSPAPLLRGGPLERPRPHPEGAAVRPDRQRGQPRGGRQGVLLLPRLHADPLVHEVPLQVPAGRVPLRASGGGEPVAGARGARVRAGGHRGLRPGPVLRRGGRVREGRRRRHPDPGERDQSRARSGGVPPAANTVVPQHMGVGAG